MMQPIVVATATVPLSLAFVALASQITGSFDIFRFDPNAATSESNQTCPSGLYDWLLSSYTSQHNIFPSIPQTTEPTVPSPSELEPWTEIPPCIQTFNKSDTFCIYTSSTFAHGRGISLFTTPSNAREIAKNAAFFDAKVLEGVNYDSNPPYVATALPGRGIGLIANRTLQRGDSIFSHTPVLIVHRETFDLFSEKDRFPFQHDAVGRLPEGSKNLFLALHGHFGGDEVDDIIHTNSFQVGLGLDDDAHNIVLPETSRMNHDCRPNAHYYFDEKTLTHYTHAIRTISPGEEITISYTDGSALRAQRQAAIKASWGFECSCSLCSQREIFTRASDERLRVLASLEEQLEDWSANSTATPQMAETVISLYEQERMDAPIAVGYTHAALAYNAAGEEYTALKYAALAADFGTLNSGPDDEDVLVMREIMKDPKSHWSWNLRMRH